MVPVFDADATGSAPPVPAIAALEGDVLTANLRRWIGTNRRILLDFARVCRASAANKKPPGGGPAARFEARCCCSCETLRQRETKSAGRVPSRESSPATV